MKPTQKQATTSLTKHILNDNVTTNEKRMYIFIVLRSIGNEIHRSRVYNGREEGRKVGRLEFSLPRSSIALSKND